MATKRRTLVWKAIPSDDGDPDLEAVVERGRYLIEPLCVFGTDVVSGHRITFRPNGKPRNNEPLLHQTTSLKAAKTVAQKHRDVQS